MLARVRPYRSAEEAIKEWTRLGIDMPERALGLVPEVRALYVEGRTKDLEPLFEEARSRSIVCALTEMGHRPRLCLVAEGDEFEALDAVLGADLLTEALERYASEGAPPVSLPRGQLSFERPLVMGILNVTPDSFSDGGRYAGAASVERRALSMVEEGVDIIDLGGESTRPGAEMVPLEEELQRTVPVVRQIAAQTDIPISIDTRKPEVARAAVAAGAEIINDVSGLGDPRMAAVAAELGVPVVLMHALADPRTMQAEVRTDTYDDIVSDIMWVWEERMRSAEASGLDRSRVLLDPGLGFGKLYEHNLAILGRLREFRCSGRPLLMGASRKGFIGKITGEKADQRLGGSLAAAALSVLNGASVVRVHDVKETVGLIRTLEAVRTLRT
jgi:dihydropteroate synthase